MNDKVVLEVRGIVKDFPGLRANDNISFQLHEGEILTLLGGKRCGQDDSDEHHHGHLQAGRR